MARVTFGSKGGRVKSTVVQNNKTDAPARSIEDVVREMKANNRTVADEAYRERSLAIHGLICARCSREFDHTNRHLLTVHHKDGNHDNNPPDGSNWENLCVYCHEDEHSRGLLGDYYEGTQGGGKESTVVYSEDKRGQAGGLGSLGAKLAEAMKKKN